MLEYKKVFSIRLSGINFHENIKIFNENYKNKISI